MKKTMVYNTNNEVVNRILEVCSNNEIDYEVLTGSLNDNVIIYNNNIIKYGRVYRKYIIIQEVYMNEWSSSLQMIMTDCDKTFQEYYNRISENSLCEI